jgi:hypothetical protein
LIGKVGLPGGLGDLCQQPKSMRKPLVLRSSFESVFSGIGTCCGDPFDIGPSGDEADDVLPLLSFRKRVEAKMTHRFPLRCADRRQLNHGFVQNRIDKAVRPPPGHPQDDRGRQRGAEPHVR